MENLKDESNIVSSPPLNEDKQATQEQNNVEELKNNIDHIIKQQAEERSDAVQQKKEDPFYLKVCKQLAPIYYGHIKYVHDGSASTIFKAQDDMIIDNYDVVHPSFLDGAAYFCAIAAINDPHAIISQAKTEFLSPIRKDMEITFEATANYNTLTRKSLSVTGKYKDILVYESTIVILALEDHIFANSVLSS